VRRLDFELVADEHLQTPRHPVNGIAFGHCRRNVALAMLAP
jgi:hypothetical protein